MRVLHLSLSPRHQIYTREVWLVDNVPWPLSNATLPYHPYRHPAVAGSKTGRDKGRGCGDRGAGTGGCDNGLSGCVEVCECCC